MLKNGVMLVFLWLDNLLMKMVTLSFEEFKQHNPDVVRTNFLMYNGIINSIRQFKLNLDLTTSHRILDSKVWFTIDKSNKQIQSLSRRSPQLRLKDGMQIMIILSGVKYFHIALKSPYMCSWGGSRWEYFLG